MSYRESSKRGSAMIAAIIIVMLIGGWMAAAFQSSFTEYKLSKRYLALQSAMNLAESGLEEGIRAYNSGDWSQWTSYGGGYFRSAPPVAIGASQSGSIKIYALPGSSGLQIAAEGAVDGVGAMPVRKQVRVELSRSNFWAMGLLARKEVIFNGNNVVVDSYDSNIGDYGLGNRNSNGNVGTMSFSNTDIHTNNADVYGFISVPFDEVDESVLGQWFHKNGTLGVWGEQGTKDIARVATDFYVDLPEVEVPNYSGYTNLPDINSGLTLGNPLSSAVQEYQTERIQLNGGALVIDGPVRLYVRRNVSIAGNGGLHITQNGSLELYVMESMSISGNGQLGSNSSTGLQNATKKPERCIIYNATPYVGGASVDISGNGQAYAVIYAPNSNVHLQGGGNAGKVCGAIVGYRITLNGGYEFHYDESLADMGGGKGLKIDLWRELKTQDELLPFGSPSDLAARF